MRAVPPVVRAAATAIVVAFAPGCTTHHQGFTVPTAAKTLDLLRQDMAAADRHDGVALCATAEYSEQCRNDVSAKPWPRLSDVHAAGVRVVDENRVVHLCGQSNGEQFETDFPVTQEPNGRLGAINPLFWTPMTFVPKPTQGAAVRPPTSAPPTMC